jgi:pimeloyl-ACP methyl ester carboxylesterase
MALIALALLFFAGSIAVAAILIRRRLRQRSLVRGLRLSGPLAIGRQFFLPIGGIEQWISIRGESRHNPILFILHGGPGASCAIFAPRIRTWEIHFTIVQWDQRGSGKTLGRTGKRNAGAVTFNQLTRDGLAIAAYLREQFPASPLILVGHSLGSTFALSMLKRRPELFAAYIGTDQNIGMLRHRESIHQENLGRFRALGLHKGIATLQRIGSDPSTWSADDYQAVTKWTMKSHPETTDVMISLLKNSILHAPGFSLKDIRNFVTGMNFSLEQLLPDIVRFDAWNECTNFAMPFFVFQGETDVLTPPRLAQSYLNDISAPTKQFALIHNAGHFAAFLKPDQFLRLLLQHVLPLIAQTPAASIPA